MRTIFRGLSLLSGLLAVALVVAHGALAVPQPRTDSKRPPPAENELPPPIVFFVAKGEPDSCGAGCNEWIAADGTIDPGAAARLRAFLNRLGKRKLPVYFHSPGGAVVAAIEMGRLMRERGMTAGVARAIPQGCNPRNERDSACDKIMRSGRELTAELRTARTLCNSSCVYALIGATVREVAPGARIGVHAIALGQVDKDGIVKRLHKEALSPYEQKALLANNERLGRYIAEMGIDKALFDAAAEIKNERIRYLSRTEIARFGIDRREFQESRWMVDDGIPGPSMVIKFAVEARGAERKEYRTSKVTLTCGGSDIRVGYERELASNDAGPTAPIVVSTRGAEFVFQPSRRSILGYNDIQMEDRFARVPMVFFKAAIAAGTVELAEMPGHVSTGTQPRVTTLSTAGLAPSLAALMARCGTTPSTRTEADDANAPGRRIAEYAAAAPPNNRKPPPPPMIFYVATGEPNICGPGCNEWIAAEGTIDMGAPQRLRALLKRVGSRKLPIYFQSPGGRVVGAMEIGRILRERGVTAGVATTIPQGCEPEDQTSKACDALKRSTRDLPSQLRTTGSHCASACVYAFAGAPIRYVDLGAALGVHASKVILVTNGRVVPVIPRALSQVVRAKSREDDARLARYLRDMGLDDGLFQLASQTSNEKMHFLTREEIMRFRIDRRSRLESNWMIDERASDPPMALKLVAETNDPEHTVFRNTIVRLTCSSQNDVRFDYVRELPLNAPTSSPIKVMVRGWDFVLMPGIRKLIDEKKLEIDVRRAQVPLGFFAAAASVESIEMAPAPEPAKAQLPQPPVKLSTAALASSVATLVKQCAQPHSVTTDRIHVSPDSVSPRKIPTTTIRQEGGHEIESGGAERATPGESRERHPAARP